MVRLSDVAADGAATRITYGVLNLAHRNDHEKPEALHPGAVYPIRVQLNDIGYAVPAGHRLRLAVSNAYSIGAFATANLPSDDIVLRLVGPDGKAVASSDTGTSPEAVTYDMVSGNRWMAEMLDRHPRLLGYVVVNPNDLATAARARRLRS